HPRQLDPEHLPVQEQQRRQRLVLRTRRNPPPRGQAGQERLHLRPAKLARMSLAIGQDKAADPGDIRLLGAKAVMLDPKTAPYPVQQPRLLATPADSGFPTPYTVVSAV